MPTVTIFGKNNRGNKIASELKIHPIDISIIEKVHAMPRQGALQVFSLEEISEE